MSNDLALCFVH